MKFTAEYVSREYQRFVTKACKTSNANKALDYVEIASIWQYCFQQMYTDPVTEELVHSIAEKHLPKYCIDTPNTNRVVLIDSVCADDRVLHQQYLRAMMYNNMEILYIVLDANMHQNGQKVLKELSAYSNVRVEWLPNRWKKRIELSQKIADLIYSFSPKHCLIQAYAYDTVPFLAVANIKNLCVYNINTTDHAYWFGASFLDYNIEFRDYGTTISMQKRNLPIEKQINLPYYPIIAEFGETPTESTAGTLANFPELPSDAIIIFTGGSFYKMLSENNFFFANIIDGMLDLDKRAVMLVAGINDSESPTYLSRIANLKNKDRIYNIGNRKDINEVFKRCDIYLGTYPFPGGLMSQYASSHAKPIVAYVDKYKYAMNSVDAIVNHYDDAMKTFTDLDDLLSYTQKLLKDVEFRKSEGKRLYNAMMTEEKFAKEFKSILDTKQTALKWEPITIDYEAIEQRYLEVQSISTVLWLILVARFRFRILPYYPIEFIKVVFSHWKPFLTKRLNRLFTTSK